MASSGTSQRNGKGKKKLNMEKIENKKNLQVTFSKRRSGLFKKASELSTLTGSEVGIGVFSPGNKMFSFGHPSVHRVMNKCFPEGAVENEALVGYDQRLVEAHMNANVEELNKQLSETNLEIEDAKKKAATIDEMEKEEMQWKIPIEKMTMSQLEEMSAHLHAVKDIVMRLKNDAGGMVNPCLNSISDPGSVPNPVSYPLGIPVSDMNPGGVPDMANLGINIADDQVLDMGNSGMNPIDGFGYGSIV